MKKYAVPLIAVVAVALVTYGYSTQLVVALPPTTTIKLDNCGVFDGAGETNNITSIIKETDSKAGVVKFTCKGVVPNPTGKTIRYNALNVPPGNDIPYAFEDENGNETFVWSQVIKPDGETTHIAHFKIPDS